MVRKPGVHIPAILYHVIARGTDRFNLLALRIGMWQDVLSPELEETGTAFGKL